MFLLYSRVLFVGTSAVDPTLDINYSDSRDAWNDWVNGINRALDPLNLEFAHVTDEILGKEVYALVSIRIDSKKYGYAFFVRSGEPKTR